MGTSHPDRNAQFEHINATATAFLHQQQPAISVDTKKKELVGDFKNAGQEWFYTRAFGATVLYESAMPYGGGIYAQLQVGKTMIMITDEQPPSPDGMMLVAAPESLGGTTTILEMYVDDVDTVYQRAVDAGGKPMMPIGEAFYGDRTGWVADPFGHIWAISTVKEELTPDQVHVRMIAAFKDK